MLTSKHNQRIKYVRRLAQKRFRDSEGKFLIEGARFLGEAIDAGWPLEVVLYNDAFLGNNHGWRLKAMLEARRIPLLEVDVSLFNEIADTEAPQGVVAVAPKPANLDFNPFNRGREGKNLLVLVDGVRDPGNLGTIIRSADAAGADAVLIIKGSVDPYNNKTLRSTMGSIFHLPVLTFSNRDKLLSDLRAGKWHIVVGDPAADTEVSKCDLTGPVVLAVGSEANGVTDEVRRAASVLVKIPMPGHAESLNAGVAAGILLYEAVRQRMLKGRR